MLVSLSQCVTSNKWRSIQRYVSLGSHSRWKTADQKVHLWIPGSIYSSGDRDCAVRALRLRYTGFFTMMLTVTALAAIAVASACSAQSSLASAVILNSGSTNTAGYRISVERRGDAEYTVTPRRQRSEESVEPMHHKLTDALVQRFFADLESAEPLEELPSTHCLKSASFGSSTIIQFGHEQTPDLSCPTAQNEHVKSLMRDVTEIARAFGSG